MNKFDLTNINERFWTFWDNFLKRVDEEGATDYSREKIVVFFVALVLALCLWFLVNLNRAYTLNLNLPIELGTIPEDRALAEDLPEFITVSLQGEGWKLLNLYNNPPPIFVDVTDGEQINIYDQVQQQMNAVPDIDVQKVQPSSLTLAMEEKITKRVPVRSNVTVNFEEQFNFVGTPVVSPDSITVTGATSVVEGISRWQTDSVAINNVRSDISTQIALNSPQSQVTLSRNTVRYVANVAEFTEGESRVFVRTRNLPESQNITFSPAFVTVKYVVPIDEYTEIQDLNPLNASVDYEVIRQDSTGFVTPQIEVAADRYNITVQSHQPEKVAYFLVVDN